VITSEKRVSAPSNPVSITVVEVPGSVTGLRATVDQKRIEIEWQPPLERPDLVSGYLVSRSGRAETIAVTEPRLEDVNYQSGETYTYSVIPIRGSGSQAVPGTGPRTIQIQAVDRLPPAVPAGLEGVASDPGGFLTWNANTERDLSGYRVFRSDRPDNGFVPVTEELHTTNAFFDPGYRTGLYYVVSAVDESGNESARSAPFRVP
jgi:hypothetical protein